MMKSAPPKKPAKRSLLRQCYCACIVIAFFFAIALAYTYVFMGLRRIAHPNGDGDQHSIISPAEGPKLLAEAAQVLGGKLDWLNRCPKCECTTSISGDADSELDLVNERGHFPKMQPSHFGMVHGMEPWERPGLKVWDLHTIPTDDWYERAKRATDRCDLELTHKTQGAENGLADKVVWVSALFDLKRGESAMGDFQRPMDEYYRRFQMVLDRGFEMVIFIPTQFEQHLKIDRSRVHIIYMNATDLKWYFPYYDRLQQIRTSKLWGEQGDAAGWLAKSPQARLEGYNPLVMSKLMLVQDAARLNPWGGRYHMWMDAGHLCAGGLSPDKMNMYKKHMSTALLNTHWPYGTTTEVHGFTDKAMHMYIGTADDPLQIVRGGIFGGQLPHIECVLKAYMIALHQTLSDGYLGTEECIWAIIFARFPHLFSPFDNNSLGNHGDNCASFQKNTMEEEEIVSGKRETFTSPRIPDAPTWWDAAQAATDKISGGGKGSSHRTVRNIESLMKSGAIALQEKKAQALAAEQ